MKEVECMVNLLFAQMLHIHSHISTYQVLHCIHVNFDGTQNTHTSYSTREVTVWDGAAEGGGSSWGASISSLEENSTHMPMSL
jgi:hypothetical protein